MKQRQIALNKITQNNLQLRDAEQRYRAGPNSAA